MCVEEPETTRSEVSASQVKLLEKQFKEAGCSGESQLLQQVQVGRASDSLNKWERTACDSQADSSWKSLNDARNRCFPDAHLC